jgi:type IV secretory pathway VirB2 component (pilin)
MDKTKVATAITKDLVVHRLVQTVVFFLILVPSTTVVYAAEFDTEISSEDQAAFDQMLLPVMKIYNFVKHAATVIAVVVLLFAGISYMMSGSDIKKRDNSKNMAGYVVLGLLVVWIAPFGVNYLVG